MKIIDKANYIFFKKYTGTKTTFDYERNNNTNSIGYGKSYVYIFRILNIIISLLVSFLAIILSTNGIDGLRVVMALISSFIIYWILDFQLIKFNNIATIARNSDKIIEMLVSKNK